MRTRSIPLALAVTALTVGLAACSGGGDKAATTTTTTPLPAGCPAQTTMRIKGVIGETTLVAATRKAVTRKNVVVVYLVDKLLSPSAIDFTALNGATARIDAGGVMIVEGKNNPGDAPVAGTYVPGAKAPLQLLGYSVQSNGAQLTGAPTRPPTDAQLEITSISDTLVCGNIRGPSGSAEFIADRVNVL